MVDAHDEAIKPAEKGDDDQAAKPPGAIVAEPPKNSPIPTVNRRISGGWRLAWVVWTCRR